MFFAPWSRSRLQKKIPGTGAALEKIRSRSRYKIILLYSPDYRNGCLFQTSVAPLLPEHPGPHLRRRQQRQRADTGGAGRATEDGKT